MMNHFVVYEAATGRIAYTAHSDADPEVILAQWPRQPGHAIAFVGATVDPRQWWVVDGTIVARAPMDLAVSKTAIAADGFDEAVITGLPDPCTVIITGAVAWGPAEVAGGTLTLTASMPGAFRVGVVAGPGLIAQEIALDAT